MDGDKDSKEKLKKYGVYVFLILGAIGLFSLVEGSVSLGDWLLLAPLTIAITEVIWFAWDSLKPEPGKKINYLQCSECKQEFKNDKKFREAMKENYCLEKDGKEVNCKVVKKTRVEEQNVFAFTALCKAVLLFVSAFIASGVVASKKIFEVYYREIGLLIIVLAVAFVYIWLNTLKFKKLETKTEDKPDEEVVVE